MFGWVLNMPFICSAKQLIGFCLIRIFARKFLPDMLLKYVQIHAKKIYTKYEKTCVLEKNPHENYYREKKF